MNLSRRQRVFMQVYRRTAELADPEYHAILAETSRTSSSRSPDWTQLAYDRAMAALETRLFTRVHIGEIPNPIGRNRWIRDEYYWRRKLPREGEINTRQIHRINELWRLLLPQLPAPERNPVYFAGLVAKATGRNDVGLSRLTASDGWHVIEALKDRLGYALREVPS
jgi:hypothetical protein